MQNDIFEKSLELFRKIEEEITQNIGLVKPLSLTCYLSKLNGVEKIRIAVDDETLPNDEIFNLNRGCRPGNLFTCHIAEMDFFLHKNNQLYCSPYNSARETYINENEGISFRLLDNLNDIKQIILNNAEEIWQYERDLFNYIEKILANTQDDQQAEVSDNTENEFEFVTDYIAQRCFTDWIGPYDLRVVASMKIDKGILLLNIYLVEGRNKIVASLNFRFEKTGKMEVNIKPEIGQTYTVQDDAFKIYDYADSIKNGVFEVLNYWGFFEKVIGE